MSKAERNLAARLFAIEEISANFKNAKATSATKGKGPGEGAH